MSEIIAVKSVTDEWLLDVKAIPFGGPQNGKDSQGEYFSAKTQLYLDQFTPVPIYYHGFDENGRPQGEPSPIGKVIGVDHRADGVWVKVALDKTKAYAARVWEAAQKGIARASSGSIAHLVRKAADGLITHWPFVEISIFDAVGKRQPINQYAVALPVIKASYERAGITLPEFIEAQDQEAGAGGSSELGAEAVSEPSNKNTISVKGQTTMELTQEKLAEMVSGSVAAAIKAQKDAEEAAAKQAKAIQEQIEGALKAEREKHAAEMQALKAQQAANTRLPSDRQAPYVTQFGNISKYDDVEPIDLAIMHGVLKAAKATGRSNGPSEDLLRALAIQLQDVPDKDGSYHVARQTMKAMGIPAMKANELNQSTLSTYGDEWVGVTYSTQLWDKIRLATQVAGNLPTIQVPQGSESIVIPLQGTSPTFYKVAQASAQDANPGRPTVTVKSSKLGTGNKTLTVAKLGAAVVYSQELEEDSLIAWASMLRQDLIAEAAEVIEHIIIDGDTDTSATTNINCIGGTPSGDEAYLLFNGFRKLALVTNTANARSAGTLDLEDYMETVKLMGLGGKNALDKTKVSFLTDPWTNWASLKLAELKTRDVFATPTIETGVLKNIYGYNVLATPNMHRANQDATYGLKANTSGKVDLNTASNNTTGSILAVRWDQWMLGYKRQMSFEVQRDALSDSSYIVVMMRMGLVNRDTEASAISYNITGV